MTAREALVPAERVAVTGVGVVSALGIGAEATFRRLIAGERAFSPIRTFETKDARCHFAAQVGEFDVPGFAARADRDVLSRTDRLALAAASEALAAARHTGGRLGIAHAGTTGAMLETERDLAGGPGEPFEAERALRFLTEPLCATTERLVRRFDASGPASTACAACASSALAIVQAMEWVRRGLVDVALAGGADALSALTFFGFDSLGALDPEPCRPFDRARRGLSLGEAGAYLVLERETRARARNAPILAFLAGAASGAEAHHVTHPEPSGARAAELVRAALGSAGLGPRDLDYVNAHGTGTVPNDRMEASALAAALGDHVSRVYVSSSKAQLGHTLGAAAALEAVITVLALGRGEVPPTVGLDTPEDSTLRHVPGRGLGAPLRAAISCSFGFGGTGSVLLFEHAETASRPVERSRESRVVVTGLAALGARGERTGEAVAGYADSEPTAPRAPYVPDPLALLDPARSRRFDRTAALVTVVVERALADARLSNPGTGLVMGTAFGGVERSVRFVYKAVHGNPRIASPAEFPHLVVSAPSGNASIYLGLRGPVFAVSDRETSAEGALAAAVALLGAGQATAFAAGGVEAFDAVVQEIYSRLGRRSEGAERGEGAAFLVLENEAVARSRGARLRARIEGPRALGLANAAAELGAPVAPERAVVVSAALPVEHAALLEASAWGHSARRSVLRASGDHEAAGAFALGAAAALVAAGAFDEALAVSGRGSVLWVTRFSRVLTGDTEAGAEH